MDISVASPELCLYSNNQVLLAGREYSFSRKNLLDSINVSLFILETTGRTRRRLNVFDTGRLGDKGYPSFCMLNNGEILMSYYMGASNKSVIKVASMIPKEFCEE